uniref:Uncharacterized protein n=1 Tax=Palpitomonas bilix TaxID=652834 RepID=A0A7S3GM76_9EUKA|mmetsp:Transcript_9278/g.25236  ORF Transcript_9278/g.25236 Transcript_9278/m.25236 type:complete len:385 (+) Transcript_9278:119-1273(+)
MSSIKRAIIPTLQRLAVACSSSSNSHAMRALSRSSFHRATPFLRPLVVGGMRRFSSKAGEGAAATTSDGKEGKEVVESEEKKGEVKKEENVEKTESSEGGEKKEKEKEKKTWKYYAGSTLAGTAIGTLVIYLYNTLTINGKKVKIANEVNEELPLSQYEVDDLRRLNHYDEEKLRAIVAEAMSASRDGKISSDEFFISLRKAVEAGMAYGFVWDRVIESKVGKDGRIDVKPMLGAFVGTSGVDDPDKLLGIIFDIYKDEGRDTLTAEQFEACVRSELSYHQVYPKQKMSVDGFPIKRVTLLTDEEVVEKVLNKRKETKEGEIAKTGEEDVTLEEFLKLMKLELCVWNECTKEESRRKKKEEEEKKRKEEEEKKKKEEQEGKTEQ